MDSSRIISRDNNRNAETKMTPVKSGNIAILGAGESGIGTAILAQKMGWSVWVSDAGKIKPEQQQKLKELGVHWEQEKHSEDKILTADLVVKSPGIPDTAPLIIALKSKGVSRLI